ncbi:phenylalanine--tRNA ligase beta subunit-related protein [Frisingicoccus sp.]
MLRQIIKGNGLYQINNVVEIDNLILVTTGQSIGSYDVEQLTGNFCLKL